VTASRSSRRSARLAAVSALFAGAAVLAAVSACSAGQITATSSEVAAVPGVNASAGPAGLIALRDLMVPYNAQSYPPGGSAPLVVRIFNGGPGSIKLTRVTSPDADGVLLVGGPAPSPTPTPSATGKGSASPSAGASASARASASAAVTTPPAPKPAGQATFSIAVASTGYALLVPGSGQYLQLTGLKRALSVGMSVQVTFSFDDGSSVTVVVPVTPPSDAQPRDSALPVGAAD